MSEDGRWLIEHRGLMDRGEAVWLERLARFDREGRWAVDGQLSAATWLVWQTNMARSTAFDKVRVARELERRPIVAEAFRAGRLSYCAARAITRLDRPDPDVDQALVDLAQSGKAGIVDVERAVRAYYLYADQDRPPPDEAEPARDVKILRGLTGGGQIVVTLGEIELEEFAAAHRAFTDVRYRPRPEFDCSCQDGPGDESSCEDGEAAGSEPVSRPAMRADAFMDLVRTALAHADDGHAAGADRYLVHLVSRADAEGVTTLEGRPVHPAQAGQVACDAATVAHLIGDRGEPLHLGRKTRDWSTAQRRAIAVRDGGRCRFVGCHYTHVDIHHIQPWQNGGPTDITNGCHQCPRHHRMLHHGYRTQGDPNGQLRFYRPDGTYLGATYPATARHAYG